MSNQLSAGEKVVVTVSVAVLAAAAGGMVFFGNAVLDMQQNLGALNADFVQFRTEVSGRFDQVDERFDGVEARLARLETLIETQSGGPPGPAD